MSEDRPPGARAHHPNIRLAAEYYENPDGLYSITACTNHRQPFFLNPSVAEEMVRLLRWIHARRGTKIWAYCLMSNHLHLLLSPAPGDSVPAIMHAYKLRSTQRAWAHGHKGTLWQARFCDQVLRDRDTGFEVIEYILDNPVRKKIVERRQDYPYSGVLDVLIPGLMEAPTPPEPCS